MSQVLADAGYDVVNHDYPSTRHGIEQLTERALDDALGQLPVEASVHFVTHSMGGILLRHYLAHRSIPHLGRVVMLGPPNQGSQVVDRLSGWPGFRLINGPAGMQLGTTDHGIARRLPAADFELGVIAGTRSVNPLLSMLLPGPNDGKVTVASTRLTGMKDHLEVAATHPMMMNHPQVIRQTLYFLRHGRFLRQH
jgi:pimeloyl-ACP methyl ester carboxylesterase